MDHFFLFLLLCIGKCTISLLWLFWTECIDGWYGENCSLPCEGNCKGSNICNHTTGLCDVGCVSGWTGPMCSKGNVGSILSYTCLSYNYILMKMMDL